MLPQRQWFKGLGLLRGMGYFEVHLDKGLTEIKVLKLRFNGLETCVGFDDFFINHSEVGSICSYPPVLRVREGAAVGVVGGHRSHKNGLVPDWQGLNWGGTGVVGLGMDGANNWGGRWSIIACICQGLTTLSAVRVNNGLELEVMDPEDDQGDVEQENGEG